MDSVCMGDERFSDGAKSERVSGIVLDWQTPAMQARASTWETFPECSNSHALRRIGSGAKLEGGSKTAPYPPPAFFVILISLVHVLAASSGGSSGNDSTYRVFEIRDSGWR